jgi:hypothetical protein
LAGRTAGNTFVMHSQDPADVRQHLDLLRLEHDLAVSIGLDNDPVYMADLQQQLATYEAAWVGVEVTQLAVSRGEREGRPQG